MADAPASGAGARKGVKVQVLSFAQVGREPGVGQRETRWAPGLEPFVGRTRSPLLPTRERRYGLGS